MGLNLPIRRIIFIETAKFDGTERRILNSQEIKQIAGRAGRKGIYDKGFCLSIQDMDYINECLSRPDDKIEVAPIGFPEILLDLPYDINYIMQTWSEINPNKPFVKMNVDVLMTLFNCYNNIDKKYKKDHTKKDVYEFITCPVDLKDQEVMHDWHQYCKWFSSKDEYEVPVFHGNPNDLNDLETFYKRLDLYFQFSRKMRKDINTELLIERKRDTINKINKILVENSKTFGKKCNICGKPLPLDYQYGICNRCFHKHRFNGGRY